ncbi:MAG TPA: hypothetical protein VFQ06_01340, partial [Nitrospira sp.]|nr:hypothetical protein [Nitrospira sp.]
MDISSLIDSLHPLEIKVLTAFGTNPSGLVLDTDQLAKATNLEASQLSMAIEWLIAKSLLAVDKETITPVVSLTPVGERYHGKEAPIEEVLAAARSAAGTGGRLTIQDLQSQEGLDPSDVSKAVGRLKKEGALLIVQGGCIESTGRPSPTADRVRTLLQQVHEGPRDLESFAEPDRQIIQEYAVRRGNAKEPFRVDDRVARSFRVAPAGLAAAEHLVQHDVAAEEVSQLSPEMLKDGSWRAKRFRKYTISLRAPRISTGKRHPYREFLDTVKSKLVSMGFREMRGTLVE